MKRTRKLLSICLSLCIFFTCIAWIKVPTAAAAETTPASTTDDPVIIVSLGDSYSSGEGIEEFFGQDLPVEDKVQNLDWLAHRSTKAWSGMLTYDKWYFAAASGAKIEHLAKMQEKSYKIGSLEGKKNLPAQLEIFDTIKADNLKLTENDFVTITIGGNDIGFVDILTTAFIEELLFPSQGEADTLIVSFLSQSYPDIYNKTKTLSGLLNEKTTDSYKATIKTNLKNAYSEIQKKAGDATILVAGYPSLFYKEGFTVSLEYKLVFLQFLLNLNSLQKKLKQSIMRLMSLIL